MSTSFRIIIWADHSDEVELEDTKWKKNFGPISAIVETREVFHPHPQCREVFVWSKELEGETKVVRKV